MDVDFYTLERKVQDRFADATRSIGIPTPIVREPPADRATVYWALGSALVSAGFVAWVLRGFGSLDSPVALAPVTFLAGYAVVAALATFCVLRAAARKAAQEALPYQAGLYLFPAGVFDARSDPLRVFRHPDLREVTLVDGRTIRVRAEGREFALRLPDPESAERARSAFDTGREQLEQALKSESQREQAMLDPLVDSGFSSPFSPQQRLLRNEPLWAKLALVIALGAGVTVGGSVWKARNVLSERRLYASARKKDEAAAYRAYLARGGRRPEVSDVLLPRAELRLSASEGTVEALERFSAAHPGTRIQVEVDAAIQAAVGAELEEAKKAGTVSALREFRKKRARYPFIVPSVEASTVALYRDVLKRSSAGRDPSIVSFFERLLGYTKAAGPKVRIQFVRRLPESVEAADAQVKRSAYFMGKPSIPSQYFTGDYALRREKAAADRLAAAIGEPFPKDIVDVQVAEAITDPSALPAPAEPTLVVDYAPEMAGGYMSPKPRGVFVGVGMTFKATFSIPGDAQPLEYKSSQWRAPNSQILKLEGTTVADVYERMATDGFDKFTKGLLALLTTGKP